MADFDSSLKRAKRVAWACLGENVSAEDVERAINGFLNFLQYDGWALQPYVGTATHKKRRSTYNVIGVGELQTTTTISEGTKLVVYRSPVDGRLWARPETEFNDGRFIIHPRDT